MSNGHANRIGQWVLFVAVLGSLTLAATITVGRRSMRMSAAMAETANQSTFASLAPGSTAQAVLEVTSIDKEGRLEGTLLEKEREDVYRRTTAQAGVRFTPTTPVVMGKASDVRAGGVVYIKGTVTPNHSVDARQVVILTGYVQVH